MAGPTVGRGEVVVTFNGKGLPAQARAMGELAGKEFAEGFDGGVGDRMDKLGKKIDETTGKNKAWEKQVKKSTTSTRSWSRSIGNVDGEMRLLIAAIVAAASEISVLGSVAGSSLTVLAAVLGSAVLGAIVGVAAFKDLGDKLETLPAAVRPVAKEFQSFVKALDLVQDGLQVAAAGTLAGAFTKLQAALVGISPALERLAAVVGDVVNRIATGLAGAAAQSTLTKLIDASAAAFSTLGDIVINVGGIIGGIWTAAIGPAQQFLDFLARITQEFSDWANSAAGQARLAEFFGTLQTVAGPLVALIATLGQTLADMVTPETVQQLVDLIGGLVGFLPILGEILTTIGELQIFSILIALLTGIGTALGPFLPLLQDVGNFIAAVLIPAFTGLGDVLAFLSPLIVGLVVGFAAFQIIEGVTTLVWLSVAAWDALKLAFLTNPIGIIIAAIVGLIAALVWFFTQTELGKEIWANFTAFLTDAWNAVVSFFQTAIPAIGDFFTTVFSAIGKFFEDWYNTWIKPVVDAIAAVFTWLIQNIIQPYINIWIAIFQGLAAVFTWLWENIVSPILTNIGLLFVGLWQTFVQPAIDLFMVGLKALGDFFTWLYEVAIKPVIDAIATAIAWLVNNIVMPYINIWISVFEAIGAAATWLWENAIRPAVDAIGAAFTWVWQNVIKPVNKFIVDAVTAIGKVIGDVFGTIGGIMKGAFDGVVSFIRGIFNGIIDLVNGVIGGINDAGKAAGDFLGVKFVKLGKLPRLAAGGITSGPTIAGEAGREIVIPLDRPLSMVNPEVRELSAALRGGGSLSAGGPQKVVTVQPGAIVVQTPARDPWLVASSVLDRLVQRV
jgi:phage-related protein